MQNIESLQFQFISEIKEKVRQAQYEALKVVNIHLINLCWELEKALSGKQKEGWRKAIIVTLSNELKKEFPNTSGFSTSNLSYMMQLYNEYHLDNNLQPLVGEISWTKNLINFITHWCSHLQHK